MKKAPAYKTRFVDAYVKTDSGKLRVNIPTCSKCAHSGVYLIRSNRTGEVIYVGYSSNNLYRTIVRHFNTWNDKRQQRFVYGKTTHQVRVILTTPARAELLEKYLIQKMKPRDNKMKYDAYLSKAQEARAAEVEEKTAWIGVNDDPPPF